MSCRVGSEKRESKRRTSHRDPISTERDGVLKVYLAICPYAFLLHRCQEESVTPKLLVKTMSSAAAASVLRLSRRRFLAAAPLGSSYGNNRSFVLAASTSSGHNDGHNNQFRYFQYSYRTLTAIAAGGSAALVSSSSTTSSSSTSCEKKKKMEAPPVGEAFPFQPPKNKEVHGPKGIPSRAQQIRRLKSSQEPYDVLVIGGGATGAGIAFDAASRTIPNDGQQLRVACIERGDFASETSSRSTKLIWAGIKYLASASAALLSWDLLTSPISTVKDFYSEFSMVVSSKCNDGNW